MRKTRTTSIRPSLIERIALLESLDDEGDLPTRLPVGDSMTLEVMKRRMMD